MDTVPFRGEKEEEDFPAFTSARRKNRIKNKEDRYRQILTGVQGGKDAHIRGDCGLGDHPYHFR